MKRRAIQSRVGNQRATGSAYSNTQIHHQPSVTSLFKTTKANAGFRDDARILNDNRMNYSHTKKTSPQFIVPFSQEGKNSTYKNPSRANALLKGTPYKVNSDHRVVSNSKVSQQSTLSHESGAKKSDTKSKQSSHQSAIKESLFSYSKSNGLFSQ